MRANDLISTLAEKHGYPKISLYFPTHVKGQEIQQDPIRLKNALQEAKAELEKAGTDPRDIETLLADAYARIDERDFWQHQKAGLAVFIEEGSTTWQKLTFTPLEEAIVGDAFHLLPLFRMAGNGEGFHILALNNSGARLFDADDRSMTERALELTPAALAAARGASDFNDDVGFHPNSRGAQGTGAEGAPQNHALGTGKDEQAEKELWRLLTFIENQVSDALADSDAPIVLVGGDRITGHYRDMAENQNIAANGVQKNTASMSDADIHAAAKDAVSGELAKPATEAQETIAARVGSGEESASTDVDAITEAARNGRVESVLIDFKNRDGAHAAILNRIAALVHGNGGQVLATPMLADDTMRPVAAAYRY